MLPHTPVWRSTVLVFLIASQSLSAGAPAVEEIGRQHIEDLKQHIAAQPGHLAVRVAPGGASYEVIVLTDADESMRVRSVHGPYQSR